MEESCTHNRHDDLLACGEESSAIQRQRSHVSNDTLADVAVSFKEKWKDPVYRGKFIYSMILSTSSLASGLYIGQHGPTFLDIQLITNTDLEEASAFFTGGYAGQLGGCLLTGIVYNKVNIPLLLFVTSIGLGLTNIALPHCTRFWLMVFMRFVSAAFMGAMATGINTQHLSIWGPHGNGLLHLLHFGFSVGGMISPLFAEPFLVEKDTREGNVTLIVDNINTNTSSLLLNTSKVKNIEASESSVEYVFYITGVFIIITSIPYLFIYFKYRQNTKEHNINIMTDKNRRFSKRNVPFKLLVSILVVFCIFIFVWNSVETNFFSYLMTFLVEEFESISKSKGAFVTSITWGTFALTRFLLIFLTKKFTPFQLLSALSTMMLISYSAFTICAHHGMADAVMVFAALSSIAMAGMFPVSLSWAETELFEVTGIVGSCILVAVSIGATANPILLGAMMEQYSNMWFGYLLLIQTFVAYLILMSLAGFSRLYVDRRYESLAVTNGKLTQKVIIVDGQKEETDCDTNTNGLLSSKE